MQKRDSHIHIQIYSYSTVCASQLTKCRCDPLPVRATLPRDKVYGLTSRTATTAHDKKNTVHTHHGRDVVCRETEKSKKAGVAGVK